MAFILMLVTCAKHFKRFFEKKVGKTYFTKMVFPTKL